MPNDLIVVSDLAPVNGKAQRTVVLGITDGRHDGMDSIRDILFATIVDRGDNSYAVLQQMCSSYSAEQPVAELRLSAEQIERLHALVTRREGGAE